MTPIIFRKYHEKDGGEVFALFPTIDGASGCCMSYQHVGQHSSADYTYCVMKTCPANPEEYSDLLKELIEVGYDDLKVYQRHPAHV